MGLKALFKRRLSTGQGGRQPGFEFAAPLPMREFATPVLNSVALVPRAGLGGTAMHAAGCKTALEAVSSRVTGTQVMLDGVTNKLGCLPEAVGCYSSKTVAAPALIDAGPMCPARHPKPL